MSIRTWRYNLRRTHIVLLHGSYSGVVDRKHQGFISWREAYHTIAARFADHLRNSRDMDDPAEDVHVFREHI